jgi:dual specificity phosphatase 3
MTSLTLPSFQTANVSPITEQLWIGGDFDIFRPDVAEAQLAELVAAGLTHIIDVRMEWDDSTWVTSIAPHVDYFHHGIDDAGQRIPDDWFDEALAYAFEAFKDPKSVVLTHCHMGINRGPSLGFAILLGLGWEPIAALDAIRAARPIAYIAYADDALDWWLRREGAALRQRRQGAAAILRWRERNEMDVVNVIRKIRTAEAGL